MEYREVEEMHPDPNDKVYQQLLAGIFAESETTQVTPGMQRLSDQESKRDQIERHIETENREQEERDKEKRWLEAILGAHTNKALLPTSYISDDFPL
jgi:hypothetical protein